MAIAIGGSESQMDVRYGETLRPGERFVCESLQHGNEEGIGIERTFAAMDRLGEKRFAARAAEEPRCQPTPMNSSAQRPDAPATQRPSEGLTRSEFLRAGACGLGALALGSALPSRAAESASNPESPVSKPMPSSPVSCDLRPFVQWIISEYEPSIRLPGPSGRYARSPGQKTPELYGTCDMACILYTLGLLRPTEKERREWAGEFQSYQDPQTGWLLERSPSHGPVHNTAFALAAMNLLGLVPERPVVMGPEYADPAAMLETIDWRKEVYPGSHKGVGSAAIHALAPGVGSKKWFDAYFAHCDSLLDPNNGMLGRDKPAGGDFDQVGGTFHYLFTYASFNRKMAYPEKRIDAVLRLQQPDGYWHAQNHLWLSFDAIYMMTRGLRDTPHRFEEVRAAVRRTVKAVERDFYSVEARRTAYNGKVGVHSVTAALCFAAEAQQFLGRDEIITDDPLRLHIDRSPFT